MAIFPLAMLTSTLLNMQCKIIFCNQRSTTSEKTFAH
uniref:Uncharacterized protein n=1 Tax=Anguilla anguilla TaxID=7936 RepID=A0A0E9PCX4_ANGAN